MPRFRTGKRRSERTASVVPVRVWIAGSEDSHLAHTLDVSNHGVKFGGCRGEFKVGDKIEVLYRHKHAQARVTWITAPEDSSEKQIEAEFLELWIAEPSNFGEGCVESNEMKKATIWMRL